MFKIILSAGELIDSIKINCIETRNLEGRQYWVKRRKFGWSHFLIPCANTFFSAAGNPVTVLADRPTWNRWEVDSFLLLHGEEGYHAFADAEQAVWAECLPGKSLERPAVERTLSAEMLTAAAHELRRVHLIPCPRFGSGWSHADPHMGNFIFDPDSGRARLIDFESAHLPTLSEAERHSDDLLIVLQCLMGYSAMEEWLKDCDRFLEAYLHYPGERAERAILRRILNLLITQLSPPTGINRVWWAVRTAYTAEKERDRRIAALSELVNGYLERVPS